MDGFREELGRGAFGTLYKGVLSSSSGTQVAVKNCQKDGWEANKEAVEFRELEATNRPLSDYQLQRGPDFDKKCRQSCKEDHLCAVAIYGSNMCWKKKLPLSNGRRGKIAVKCTTATVKVPTNNATRRCRDKSTLILVGSVLLGSSAFFNLFLLSAILAVALFCYHKKSTKLQSVSIIFATTSGVLASDPERFVAVKKLHKVIQEGEKEFKTEVTVISQTHHRNFVGLLGYCNEGEHLHLVYEFMSNGSLANLLFGIFRPEWSQRVQIAFEIARGLMYLHEECCTQIIHCDIKPQNIFLDDHFTPRISDFGLAKLLLADQARTTRTGIRGTIGYFAPEWFRKESITAKVDVYSDGGMLLEIICSKSSVVFADNEEEEDVLMDWAYECYMEGKLEEMVDDDEEARKDTKRVERMVKVAFWCIQEDPGLRPTMRKVTQMLDGLVKVPVPPRPFGVFISLS
ncbi:hypothetical protein VitviT2T_003720 [Vitis vinifera]|uniref:Protein kinase domain-containing protein n=2 Tax=Vitis vinifera TaxID=29760 RepID=A0ABY9BMH2_VITVI|nr:hypothetical protein VitviT2T_003720 [Vitis vinifera]